MGGYYKLKKILLILCITLTAFRIINSSKVFASEAVEVTPVWNDGDYTYQADNQYLTLYNNQVTIQNELIYQLRYNYDNYESFRNNIYNTCVSICDILVSRRASQFSKFLWVGRFPIGVSNTSTFYYEVLDIRLMNNISYNDATLNDGYKILSVPFFSYTRTTYSYQVSIAYNSGISDTSLTSGSVLVPCAEVGAYSPLWLDLFEHVGVLNNSSDYNSLLNSIEETAELNYTQNYYTNQAVSNTYDYITNDNIDTISNLGFSQPNNSEDIDLTDCFDELEALLTGENYSNKSFTFSIPGNRNYTFSIAPTMLETNLTRVGGSAIISIIHAMWYIGLFGWYIFAYLGIWGKFLSGDWLHLVNHTSPVNKIVKMSVSTFGGGS